MCQHLVYIFVLSFLHNHYCLTGAKEWALSRRGKQSIVHLVKPQIQTFLRILYHQTRTRRIMVCPHQRKSRKLNPECNPRNQIPWRRGTSRELDFDLCPCPSVPKVLFNPLAPKNPQLMLTWRRHQTNTKLLRVTMIPRFHTERKNWKTGKVVAPKRVGLGTASKSRMSL